VAWLQVHRFIETISSGNNKFSCPLKKTFINDFVCFKSKKREVPPQIVRPDYAEHPEGLPLGEIAERGSTNVKVLDDEEIEGLKLACKVILFLFLVYELFQNAFETY
jgi:hypothetical protein